MNNLTAAKAKKIIEDIIEGTDELSDGSAALRALAQLAKNYEAWETQNSVFVKNNNTEIARHRQQLAEIIKDYREIQGITQTARTLAAGTGGGETTIMKIEVCEKLIGFEESFCQLLTQAVGLNKTASVEND